MTTLDENQKAAVESEANSLVIIAAAGSGKTRVFTERIKHIIQEFGYSPGRILAMTFTRTAAFEIRERLEKSGCYIRGLTIGTFHSVFFRLINEYAPRLDYKRPITAYDEHFSTDVLVDEMIIMGLPYPDRQKNEALRGKDPRIIQATFDRLEFKSPNDWKRVKNAYDKKLKKHNAVGFDEMISLMVELLEKHEDVRLELHNLWNWILIDEGQDTDAEQMKLIRLLDPKYLTVVGDTGQAIFEWRSASPQHIIDLSKTSEVIHLDANYRSTKSIIEASNKLLKYNLNDIPRDIKPTWYADEGEVEIVRNIDGDTALQAAEITREQVRAGKFGTGEIAVLCRTNYLAGEVSNFLTVFGVPHRLVSRGGFWKMSQVRSIFASLMLLQNIFNDSVWYHAINFPFNRLTPLSRSAIRKIGAKKRLPLFVAASRLIDKDEVSGDDYELANWTLRFMTVAGRYYQSVRDGSPWNVIECLDNLNEYMGWSEYYSMLPSTMTIPQAIFDRIRLQAQHLSREMEGKIIDLKGFLEWYAARDLEEEAKKELPLVTVCTGHAAKGLEWPLVILPGWVEDKFPSRRTINEGRVEEERRLAYVMITRAKNKCIILTGDKSSRFVHEAGLFDKDQEKLGSDDDEFL